MILTATGYGLGTLWIANTCFAYNDLVDFIGTDCQLTGLVAVGIADESPDKRPRKPFEDIQVDERFLSLRSLWGLSPRHSKTR